MSKRLRDGVMCIGLSDSLTVNDEDSLIFVSLMMMMMMMMMMIMMMCNDLMCT